MHLKCAVCLESALQYFTVIHTIYWLTGRLLLRVWITITPLSYSLTFIWDTLHFNIYIKNRDPWLHPSLWQAHTVHIGRYTADHVRTLISFQQKALRSLAMLTLHAPLSQTLPLMRQVLSQPWQLHFSFKIAAQLKNECVFFFLEGATVTANSKTPPCSVVPLQPPAFILLHRELLLYHSWL